MNFCPGNRGRFKDVVDMDETMIREWNEEVAPEDEVFILGDVAFCNAQKATAIMRRLNGTKILIEGNHDVKALNDPSFRGCFKEVHKYLRYVHEGQLVIMFHYPIHEWDQMHRGAVHFYGHVHGKETGLEKYRARDVAFDATGQVVSRLDYMIADAMSGVIKSHH
jgi:calcineurin-like phosphoesterase family protein